MNIPAASSDDLDWRAIVVGAAVAMAILFAIPLLVRWGVAMRMIGLFGYVAMFGGLLAKVLGGAIAGSIAKRRGTLHGALAGTIATVGELAARIVSSDGRAFEAMLGYSPLLFVLLLAPIGASALAGLVAARVAAPTLNP